MNLKCKLLSQNSQKTSKWSGGTTTEIFIYPKNAIYANRDFKWRLSSAEIEILESDFTHLNGITRWIMTLKGDVRLIHDENHKEIYLKPFEPYEFNGEWETKSKSCEKVRDFNLMLSDGYSGNIGKIQFKQKKQIDLLNKENLNNIKDISYVFYCVVGNFEIELNNKIYNVKENETFYINLNNINKNDKCVLNLNNKSLSESIIAYATIKQNDF